MAIVIPEEYSYVALVVVASYSINMVMSLGVVEARKKYGVQYPTMYAVESENKDAKAFNCVQRGHQNFLEAVPFFLALLLISGLQHPRLASIAGVLFLFARLVYFKDYSSGGPDKRWRGAMMAYLGILVLMGCAVSFPVHQMWL